MSCLWIEICVDSGNLHCEEHEQVIENWILHYIKLEGFSRRDEALVAMLHYRYLDPIIGTPGWTRTTDLHPRTGGALSLSYGRIWCLG